MRLPLAALLLGLSSCAWGQPPYERIAGAVLSLEVPGGSCTGVSVAKHTVLTASHCYEFNMAGNIGVNGKLCAISQAISDGQDHQFLIVDCTFSTFAKFGKPPVISDWIFVYGDPVGFHRLLRFGTVAGFEEGNQMVVDVTCGPGDSGGGIFNARGQMIGLVSWGRPPFRACVSLPFKFTPAQLREAGL